MLHGNILKDAARFELLCFDLPKRLWWDLKGAVHVQTPNNLLELRQYCK